MHLDVTTPSARPGARTPGRLPRALALGAAALGVALVLGAPPALAEIEQLTLYQKTARAALVVRARATSDSTRRPVLEVLQVLKGTYSHPFLTIVPFRQDYTSERPWLRSESFRTGREYVLFLNPYEAEPEDDDFPVEDPRGEELEDPPSTLFIVLNAHLGVLDIPAEGAEALTSALGRFASILALHEFDLQSRAFRALLRESNPHLLEAGLEQVARFRLGVEDDLDALEPILSANRVSFRRSAVEILAQIAAEARREGRTLARRAPIYDRVASLALADDAVEVREQSVRALAEIAGPDAGPILRRISLQDPDQGVRYSAEVTLAEIEGQVEPRRAP